MLEGLGKAGWGRQACEEFSASQSPLSREASPGTAAAPNYPAWSGLYWGEIDIRRGMTMSDMRVVEIKAFVPARDFTRSKQFYQDLGFTVAWSSDDLAYVRHGDASFLLQKFYVAAHAGNFMMHLQVEDVDAWWRHVETHGLAAKYGVKAELPADRPWGMRDFLLVDPTGVLWRVAQNIPDGKAATDG